MNQNALDPNRRPSPYEILSQQVANSKSKDVDTLMTLSSNFSVVKNDSKPKDGETLLSTSSSYSAGNTDTSQTDSGFGSSLETSLETKGTMGATFYFDSSSSHGDEMNRYPDPLYLRKQAEAMQFGAREHEENPPSITRTFNHVRERSFSVGPLAHSRHDFIPGSGRIRQIPSYLPLTAPSNREGSPLSASHHQDGRIWDFGQLDSYLSFLPSAASTPGASGPSMSFPFERRRTDSESMMSNSSMTRANSAQSHFMQDEQYGTDWLDRPTKIKREYLPFNATSIPPPSISDSGSFDANLGITYPLSIPPVWCGRIPTREYNRNVVVFSCKVFLGGVPWDTDDELLASTFQEFGNIRVEWPNRDNCPAPPKGYVYIIFESEKQVKKMLGRCTIDPRDGGSYFYVSSRKFRAKEVQVIPWVLSDSNYVPIGTGLSFPGHRLDTKRTVFVGALHGVMTAENLYRIFNETFGDVIYAGIDTDKYKYPIGSGRVTFSSFQAFMRAVKVGYVEVRTTKFRKKLQIEPYLEDSQCCKCNLMIAPYFCRDPLCFKYYCKSCWTVDHPEGSQLASHKVITRTERNTIMRASMDHAF
ncbi:cytoplasmic polyadenylation element-binding protein 1-like [Artemia franciscana]